MSKEIYTCDACHYTFEAETGISGSSKAHREVELRNCGGKTKWLPEMIWSSW